MLIITRAPAGKTSKRGGSKRDTEGVGRASRSDAFFAFRAISINSVKIKRKIKIKKKRKGEKNER